MRPAPFVFVRRSARWGTVAASDTGSADGEARVGPDCTDDVSWPPLAAAGAVDEDDDDDENDGDDVLSEEAEFEAEGCMAQQAY